MDSIWLMYFQEVSVLEGDENGQNIYNDRYVIKMIDYELDSFYNDYPRILEAQKELTENGFVITEMHIPYIHAIKVKK